MRGALDDRPGSLRVVAGSHEEELSIDVDVVYRPPPGGGGRHQHLGGPLVYGCSNRMEASISSSSSLRFSVYAAVITTRVPSTS